MTDHKQLVENPDSFSAEIDDYGKNILCFIQCLQISISLHINDMVIEDFHKKTNNLEQISHQGFFYGHITNQFVSGFCLFVTFLPPSSSSSTFIVNIIKIMMMIILVVNDDDVDDDDRDNKTVIRMVQDKIWQGKSLPLSLYFHRVIIDRIFRKIRRIKDYKLEGSLANSLILIQVGNKTPIFGSATT